MGLTSINVLDLPRLRDEPSFKILVQALEALAIKPSLWSGEATPTENTVATSRYLTSILSSGFEWFQDPTSEKSHGLLAEEQKEFLWNLASARLTERCGRSAQGELTRTWTIPANENHPDLNIVIREPPLTGDNLGHKTWGTAWAIAQKLDHFHQYFSHILSVPSSNPQILELGSGTGLLGLAAAAIWKTNVILTDLPTIQENLLFNTHQNTPLLNSRNALVTPDILDWTSPSTALPNIPLKQFPLILLTDPLYDTPHPLLVSNIITRHLHPGPESCVLVAIPRRDAKTTRMLEEFRELMVGNGLRVLYEGTEVCRDDWVSARECEGEGEGMEGGEVRCWWGVWGW